jgi:serine/threonine protein phosphatase 1
VTVGLFKRKSSRKQDKLPARTPSGPPNTRAYAIGDVHGRLDLLEQMFDLIAADRRERPCDRVFLVLLGDLIDRGPDSAGVIDFVLRARTLLPNMILLMGNHEEMLLRVLDQDTAQFRDWLRFGGYECAQSYGVEVGRLALLDASDAAALVRSEIPDAHIAFLESFVDSFQFGDYLFVHAGIRPGVAVEDQNIRDLRWIREEFLDSNVDHQFVIVHGHTISEEPDERPNRIGIDTGAYVSGILTALCLEGAERRYLHAVA